MAKVKLPLKGSCHCGKTSYELAEPPVVVYACHCTNCQKISGSAFALSLVMPAGAFSLTGGETDRITWVADSGNERWGEFCKSCGTRLRHGSEAGAPFEVVRAGTLDDTSWIVPTAHIWTASAQPWVKFAEDDVLFEGQPQDYMPMVERFQAQGLF